MRPIQRTTLAATQGSPRPVQSQAVQRVTGKLVERRATRDKMAAVAAAEQPPVEPVEPPEVLVDLGELTA